MASLGGRANDTAAGRRFIGLLSIISTLARAHQQRLLVDRSQLDSSRLIVSVADREPIAGRFSEAEAVLREATRAIPTSPTCATLAAMGSDLDALWRYRVPSDRGSVHTAVRRHHEIQPLSDEARRRLKVGIVWSGSVTVKRNQERARSRCCASSRALCCPAFSSSVCRKARPNRG